VNGAAIRVLIVDPNASSRRALGRLLRGEGVTVVAEAADEDAAAALAAEHEPDVVMVDPQPPALHGERAVRRLVEASPRSRIVVVADSAASEDVRETVAAGACGYLLKGESVPELVACVRAAAGARSLILPGTAASELVEQAHASLGLNGARELSRRELEVLRLVAEGHDNGEIGAVLHISPATAKSHVSRILAKLNKQNRVQAAVYAVRTGLI
jgi:DNA-binding NarL/FixJ family response regulator